jgi:hypothetical protein
MKNNKQNGFVEMIVIIIIALLLMKYFGITVSTVVAWGKVFLAWFTTFFKDILK